MSTVRYISRATLLAHGSSLRDEQPRGNIPVYEIDLDDLKDADANHEAHTQRAERVMLKATAEWLELTGRAELPLPKGEHEQLREVFEAMRPIVDAALDWSAAGGSPKPLHDIIEANRARLAAAVSAWSVTERARQSARDLDPSRLEAR